MKVYLDGKFVSEEDASISVFDAAVQHGVGLFETMRAYHGRVYRLDEHIRRLIRSARETGLTQSLRHDPLCEAVEHALKKSQLAEARIRLTVTGGNLALLARAQGKKQPAHQPSVLIAVTEPTAYPEAYFAEGVTVAIAEAKANPFDPLAGHKSLQYWQRLQALAAAASIGAAESLWFSVTNHLCGGSVSNAILIKDQQLLTPIAHGEEPDDALRSAVLPGITRAAILEIAGEMELPIQKKMLTINDVLEADEMFLTNSSWGILPVVRVEKETIGSGVPGTVMQDLYQRLLADIAEACAAGAAHASN